MEICLRKRVEISPNKYMRGPMNDDFNWNGHFKRHSSCVIASLPTALFTPSEHITFRQHWRHCRRKLWLNWRFFFFVVNNSQPISFAALSSQVSHAYTWRSHDMPATIFWFTANPALTQGTNMAAAVTSVKAISAVITTLIHVTWSPFCFYKSRIAAPLPYKHTST